MTHPDRAIEAAEEAAFGEMDDRGLFKDVGEDLFDEIKRDVTAAVIAAYETQRAAEGLVVVQRGSVGEHKLGLEWFEQTFGVPLGDKPGRIKADEIRAMLAAAQEQNDAGG